MAQSSYPFGSIATSESQFGAMFRHIQDSGVVGTGLKVSADSSGMQVAVTAGEAFVRGTFYSSTAREVLPIAPSSSSPRIDTVVLQMDPFDNETILVVRQGIPAASPNGPSLERTTTGIFEEPLADIWVGANVTTIAEGDPSDRRAYAGTRVRPWVSERRPLGPFVGQTGFNMTLGVPEIWTGTEWVQVGLVRSGFPGATFHYGSGDPSNDLGVDGDVYFDYS